MRCTACHGYCTRVILAGFSCPLLDNIRLIWIGCQFLDNSSLNLQWLPVSRQLLLNSDWVPVSRQPLFHLQELPVSRQLSSTCIGCQFLDNLFNLVRNACLFLDNAPLISTAYYLSRSPAQERLTILGGSRCCLGIIAGIPGGRNFFA